MVHGTFGGFQGIVFDAYGTLFDVAGLEHACETITDNPVGFSQMWRAKQLEYSVLRTVMDRYVDFGEVTSDALDFTVSIFRTELAPQQRRVLMQAWQELPAFADVPSALEQLHAFGQRMLILSNGTRFMLEPLLARNNLGAFFTAVLTSDRVQVFKPDPLIYHLVTERIYARLNEILFVTANGFDVAGAKSAGFTVCRVNRQGLPLDPLGFEPDIVVRDLLGLVDALLDD
jgi:2-haloacid dehalogenase